MVKICPNCGSFRVMHKLPQMWSIFICKDCGYEGPAIEKEKESKPK